MTTKTLTATAITAKPAVTYADRLRHAGEHRRTAKRGPGPLRRWTRSPLTCPRPADAIKRPASRLDAIRSEIDAELASDGAGAKG